MKAAFTPGERCFVQCSDLLPFVYFLTQFKKTRRCLNYAADLLY